MPGTHAQQLPEGFLDVFGVATLPSTHPAAFIERGGKAIHTTTQQGFLCFGQYKKGYPVMPLQAIFSISIDNNTMDDRNIFIIDVYDHHIDRVLGKRVITRKDFEKANEFCLFTFDFTPPSNEANMEFRIYYMGYAYVLADKIAVIDPAKVSITQTSDIPEVEVPESTEPEEIKSELPEPWKIAKIGKGDGKVVHHNILISEVNSHKGELQYVGDFTIEATGEETHGRADDLYFIYQKWTNRSGNGKVVGEFLSRNGFVGVMFRETLERDSKFIMMESNRVLYRRETGDGVKEKVVLHGKKPGGGLKLKFIRKRSGGEQYYIVDFSLDSDDRDAEEDIRFELPQEAYVGLAAANATATVQLGMKYKDANYREG
jgi:hypothetical protein